MQLIQYICQGKLNEHGKITFSEHEQHLQTSPDTSEPSSLWSPLYFMQVLHIRTRSFMSQHNKLIIYMLFYSCICAEGRTMALLSGEGESLLWAVMLGSTVSGPQKMPLSSSCSSQAQSEGKISL